MAVIELSHLTKDYGGGKGIFDLSFSVEAGEIMGFLGPNGAGKTTAIRQLMGFTRPQKGSVKINGLDCFANAHVIQKTLGYLPGEMTFFDDLTGIEFVKLMGELKGLKSLDRAKELMALFALNATGKIQKMSKGMKQKIGIVCAFMGQPDILILDEPSSGLDPLMQTVFIDLVLAEQARGATILMSSHIFEEIERTCSRTAIIRAGKMVAVENMAVLRAGKGQSYCITLADEAQAQGLCAALQLPATTVEGRRVTTHIKNPDALIKAAAQFTVEAFETKNESLEDIFLHFYAEKSDTRRQV